MASSVTTPVGRAPEEEELAQQPDQRRDDENGQGSGEKVGQHQLRPGSTKVLERLLHERPG